MIGSTRSVPPRAGAMMEALRGLGYSTATALADLVDNSVSAGATEVRIDFFWEGPQSRITMLDNGHGMDDAGLESAMRLGERNPLAVRDRDDLGRFGLGLKTASLSQCRRLTVASLREGSAACCLRWDLDALAARPEDGWLLFEGAAPGSDGFLAPLHTQHQGTLVLWENLDRIVTAGYAAEDFLTLADTVQSRLAMIFHRLLQGPRPRLRLRLNGQAVAPWDPFMEGHPGKPWASPVSTMKTDHGVLSAQCHVLPHKDRLPPEEHESAGGPEGWTTQQGFYVYRNERLLLAGGWLGLGQGRTWNREEAHRLARIRLDIPNTADAEWKIDIRKSTARPPVSLRPWLTRLAEDTRNRARNVFAFRGKSASGTSGIEVEQAWRADHTRSGIRYRIDEKHPAIAAVLDSAGPLLPMVRAMLRVVEETVPVQRIWLDTAENRDTPETGFSGEAPERVTEVLLILYTDMVTRKGMTAELARRTLLATAPFHNHPALVAALPDTVGQD